MLNAFRHHGLLRRPSQTARSEGLFCAQRLSASRIITRNGNPVAALQIDPVLNAFRHHGLLRVWGTRVIILVSQCSTPFGITDYYAYAGSVTGPTSYRCSTPFGITDYYAFDHCGGRRDSPVLNAFRHHGLLRHSYRSPEGRPDLVLNAFRHHGLLRNPRFLPFGIGGVCSTPFGITDYYAQNVRRSTGPTMDSAQRLSASRIITLSLTDDLYLGCKCSNAFRHHGLLRAAAHTASSLSVSGAQRLSASRIITPFSGSTITGPVVWCSTPFGITDYYALL